MSDQEPHSGNGRPHIDADERAAAAVVDAGLVDTAVGVVRLTAFAWLRTAQWTAKTTARAASLTMRAAVSGMPPREVFRATGADARDYVLKTLGLEEQIERNLEAEEAESGTRRSPLRERGEELMARSADVHFDEDMHPAYERILSEISPDEGRILRLLADEGPQPAVDVRTARPLGIGSELIAPGLSMIGAEAGCRHVDRVPAYLNNLFRLGLVWFSREPIKEPLRYQVLEAQPDVLDAMKKAGRGSTVRRSIELTPFGMDFCAIAIPDEKPGAEGKTADDG